MIDEKKPFPEEIWIYKCRNCDDIDEYYSAKDAMHQCWRHDHKSSDEKCNYSTNMDVAHYIKVKDHDVDKEIFEYE